MLVLGDFAFRFVSAHLLIERIQELLPGGSAGKCGAIVEGSAETPEVQQPFGRAVESNAHAVEQIDDGRGGVAHGLHRRLVGQKVATVNGVVKVLPGGIAFPL